MESDSYIEHIVTVVVASINIPLHLFVLIAILSHWSLIKRNIVNIYAGNVVFGGLVASVWAVYTSARILASREFTVEYEEFNGKSNRLLMTIQTINLNIVLVTAGSIGLLIYAMRSIQFRVHKTVGGVSNSSTKIACETPSKPCSRRERFRKSHKKNPKRWAAFYITMVWLIPVLIAIFSTLFGSCVSQCHCKYLHRPVQDEQNVQNCEELTPDECSNLLLPLDRATVIAAIVLYILYILVLTFSLMKTKNDLEKIAKRRCDSIRTLSDEKTKELTAFDVKSSSENSDEAKRNADDKRESMEKNNEEAIRKESDVRRSIAIKFNNGKSCRKMSGSIFIRSLKKNFKLLFIVFIVYVLGSIPLVVLAILDVVGGLSGAETLRNDLSTIIGIIPFFGHAICTILISVYLSGIRSASRSLAAMFTRCFQ